MEQKLRATHQGIINLGGFKIRCYNLDNGERVLSREGFLRTLGRTGNPKYKEKIHNGEDNELFLTPVFLSASNLKDFISKDLITSSQPFVFEAKGRKKNYGYKAEILPQVCYVYIDGEKKGVLTPLQQIVAEKCRILIRALATTGIIALIDEATGYQEIRDKLALQKILDKYLLKEYAKWARRFPSEFYELMFDLKGWQWKGMKVNRPSVVGTYTNDIVYSRLAPGVLAELKRLNPPDETGRRKLKHHQWLTEDIGHPALQQHIQTLIAFMRASSNWGQFHRMVERAFTKFGETIPLNFDE